MTLTEFFLQQSLKDMRAKFKEVGLIKYNDFPENLKKLCSLLGLEDDKKCTHYYTIKRWSTAEVYMHFSLPNPAQPCKPMDLELEFYVKSAKAGCTITYGLESHIDIFHYVSPIFDDRREYNNIEFRVWKQCLPEIFNEEVDEWDKKKKHYPMKENLTAWDYYQAVCKYAEGVKPLLDMFVKATENGEFEKLWNKLNPRKKFNKGHEPFKAMFFPVVMNRFYEAVRAGANPNLEDFVILFAVSDEVGKNNIPGVEKLQEAFNKASKFNATNEEIFEGYNFALNYFRQKYMLDDSFDIWNKTYTDANKELIKEVKTLKKKLSEKYNINEEYLECILRLDNEFVKEISWNRDFIPQDAYVKAK